MKDVKKISDIPGIENYLNNVFKFLCYDKGDGLVVYVFEEPGVKTVTLEVCKEEHKYIMGIDKLVNIIADEKEIQFLQWSESDFFNDHPLGSYCYRPLVPEDQKDYENDIN